MERPRLLVATGALVVLLAAGSWQLGAAPPALAQQTCGASETFCLSGPYTGQCRPKTVACSEGSVSATVDGCTPCACPAGQLLCGSACAPSSAGEACTAPNGDVGAWDACRSTCVTQVTPVVIAPGTAQPTPVKVRADVPTRPAISVDQTNPGGLLLDLQARGKNIATVDGTGLQVGWSPDVAKLGNDLSAAGGQNLIYGVARSAGVDAFMDSLLKLESVAFAIEGGRTVNVNTQRFRIAPAGNVTIGGPRSDLGTGVQSLIYGIARYLGMDENGRLLTLSTADDDERLTSRFSVDRDGNVRASGSVRGSALCIGMDCKTAWLDAVPEGVRLQATSPGTVQDGNVNIRGTAVVGGITVDRDVTIGARAPGPAVELRAISSGNREMFTVAADGSVDIVLDRDEDSSGAGAALFSIRRSSSGGATGQIHFTVDASTTTPLVSTSGTISGARLGVGTLAPVEALHVAYGNARIAGSGGFDQTGEVAEVQLGDANHTVRSVYGSGVRIGTYQAPDGIVLQEGTGNVGIGVRDPGQRLDVPGRIQLRASSNSAGVWLTDAAGTQDVFVGLQGTSATAPFGVWSGGAWRLTVTNDGNVGIGTREPGARLEVAGAVRGSAEDAGALRVDTGSGSVVIGPKNTSFAHVETDRPKFFFNKPVDFAGALSSYGGGNLHLQTGGTTRIFVRNSDGVVGIGTTNPTSALTVAGSVAASGNVQASGLLTGDRIIAARGVESNGAVTASTDVTAGRALFVRGRPVLGDLDRRPNTCTARSCSVSCLPGWVAVGGGCATTRTALSQSRPYTTGEGWFCGIVGTSNDDITAYVRCAKPTN